MAKKWSQLSKEWRNSVEKQKLHWKFIDSLLGNQNFLNLFYKTLVIKDNTWKFNKDLEKKISHLGLDQKYVDYVIATYGEHLKYTEEKYPNELKEWKICFLDWKDRWIIPGVHQWLSIVMEYDQLVEKYLPTITFYDDISLAIMMDKPWILWSMLYKIRKQSPWVISDAIVKKSLADNLGSY